MSNRAIENMYGGKVGMILTGIACLFVLGIVGFMVWSIVHVLTQ